MVRPYVRTRGRASTSYDLRLESLISATRLRVPIDRSRLGADHLAICQLCTKPTSVAEIAAHLRAPLGVARVLIGDGLDLGLLMLHENTTIADGRPPLELLHRVVDGLRKLA
ncbi:Protein of unknown function [Amycolatopsis arida]|uniref:DUF742 domain-containing protein n=1 Tax=Amycolatopsis arida TaxID=587909 RepID=A0A1I5V885_9PSEU|nr:DUF742 domain-containing protein [Amycolatopsis arida]TDX91183.1 uncharacterized protein DUF742 [Amycolatopsis arida]SFQ03632.1 Protein of unknown function [Amycolatopsis arida]